MDILSTKAAISGPHNSTILTYVLISCVRQIQDLGVFCNYDIMIHSYPQNQEVLLQSVTTDAETALKFFDSLVVNAVYPEHAVDVFQDMVAVSEADDVSA